MAVALPEGYSWASGTYFGFLKYVGNIRKFGKEILSRNPFDFHRPSHFYLDPLGFRGWLRNVCSWLYMYL